MSQVDWDKPLVSDIRKPVKIVRRSLTGNAFDCASEWDDDGIEWSLWFKPNGECYGLPYRISNAEEVAA